MKTPIKCFPFAILFAFLSINSETFAQVGIGTSTPNDNSLIDVSSTTKGFLPPRMTTTERNTFGTQLLITPDVTEKGMLVFDTTLTSYYYWDGLIWVGLDSSNFVDLTTMQTIAGMKTFTGDLTPKGRLMLPMGEINYFSAAGTTFNLPSNGLSNGATNMYLILPGGAGTSLSADVMDFVQLSNGRLKYTGTVSRMFHIACTISMQPVVDTNNQIFVFGIYKNNATDLIASKVTQKFRDNTDQQSTALHVAIMLAPNDDISLWAGNMTVNGGDIEIHTITLFALGM